MAHGGGNWSTFCHILMHNSFYHLAFRSKGHVKGTLNVQTNTLHLVLLYEAMTSQTPAIHPHSSFCVSLNSILEVNIVILTKGRLNRDRIKLYSVALSSNVSGKSCLLRGSVSIDDASKSVGRTQWTRAGSL